MAQPKVFVSHSHVDDAFAERLVKDLRAAGADTWLDKTDLGAGDFQARISAALANCEWFVLVLTRSALASNWVVQEVNAANSLKHAGQLRDLIFLQAGPMEHRELPALWRVYNIFDATADYVAARDRVATTVGATRPTKPSAPPSAPQATISSGRAPTLGIALVRADLAEKRVDDALKECESLLKYYPNDPDLWRFKAEALRKLGRYPEANVAAQRAEQLER